jgi:hypothetical protein
MAVFEPTPLNAKEKHPEPGRSRDGLWNLLTVLVIAGMVFAAIFILAIFINPNVSFNPYPPPTMPVALIIPTRTPITTQPSATPEPSITPTPEPTFTSPPPSPTATMVGRDVHPTATTTPQENAIYAFSLQSAPAAIDAAMLYPDRGGCKWMGVGGQVVDLQGRPVTGISVMLGGSADSRPFDQTSLTGTALKYGEAGYEFTLANNASFGSQGGLWVRLIDQQRLPLSPKIYFDTSEDCAKGLVIVNFKQVR